MLENNKNVFLFQGVGSDIDKSLSAFRQDEKEVLFGLCKEVSDYAGIDLLRYIDDRSCLKENTDVFFAEWLITGLCDCTVFEMFKRAGIEPDYIVGYSLGLNNAMCCSGAITLRDSTEILRGVISSLKNSLNSSREYDMGMIIGLEYSTVTDIINEVSSFDRVKVASENSEFMIVISGLTEDVNAVLAKAAEEGALKAFPLCVLSPFHTSLMKEFSTPYFNNLEKISFSDSNTPMISIYSQKEFSTAEESYNEQCRNFLEQMKWKDTIDYLEKLGVRDFYDMSVTAANKKASVLNNPESGFKTIKSLRKH